MKPNNSRSKHPQREHRNLLTQKTGRRAGKRRRFLLLGAQTGEKGRRDLSYGRSARRPRRSHGGRPSASGRARRSPPSAAAPARAAPAAGPLWGPVPSHCSQPVSDADARRSEAGSLCLGLCGCALPGGGTRCAAACCAGRPAAAAAASQSAVRAAPPQALPPRNGRPSPHRQQSLQPLGFFRLTVFERSIISCSLSFELLLGHFSSLSFRAGDGSDLFCF